MKRLIIIASLAILAVGCQKTEIQNEVQTPIGFSTEVGKQTRAIVSNTYDPNQPFAVYAYGHQGNAAATTVMNNVEVSYTAASGEGTEAIPAKWSATGTTKYYWPNDPTTTLNFYAYSPSDDNANVAAHQKLNGTIVHSETAGLSITNYGHDNMYVDFMVATPVVGATYSATDPNQLVNNETSGTVPVVFNHQMTQVLFNVTTDKEYSGVTFIVEEITLKNIHNVGNYSNVNLIPSYFDSNPASFKHGSWSNTSVLNTGTRGTYTIFPALAANGGVADDEVAKTVTNTSGLTTTGVTMIPQDMVEVEDAVIPGTDTYANQTEAQMFEITYSVEGTGVATETVTKHVPFYAKGATSVVNWGVNQKITYTVKIGLNEILFAPSVADWTGVTGETYTFQQ